MVTARHFVAGLPPNSAPVELFAGGKWSKLDVKIIFPKNAAVDIAVLKIPAPISVRLELVPSGTGLLMGQEDVYFLGFPSGLHSSFPNGGFAPFVKRGTMSAVDATNKSAIVLYIDGFNNPGFSGGPVVFLDHNEKKWKAAGVVSGYRPEAAKVFAGDKVGDTNVLVNSGILVAYDIRHAVEAIDADK